MGISVLIADDHAPFRALVAETVEAAGMRVCGQAATAQSAVELATRERPDVCLLDIRMPGDGVHAARRIAAILPGTRVLMLTVSAESDDVLDALQAGASGYLLKGAPPEEITQAIRAVFGGDAIVAPAVTPALVEEIRRARARHVRTSGGTSVQLTEREWRILELLDSGSPTVEIAQDLYVAPVTVRSHIAALVRKLGAQDRAEALALYRGQREQTA
jgi:two-component system nitrate/nitrite response regulator NarL